MDPVPSRPGWPFTITVYGQPVSLQGGAVARSVIRNAVRDFAGSVGWHCTGDVEITVQWYGPETERYERTSSPDLDNILKPILDGLKGPSGCLIDDCQVQSLRASWIDLPRGSSPRFTVEVAPYMQDDHISSRNLVMLEVLPGLCVPTRYLDDSGARSSWAATMEHAFQREARFVEEFGEAHRDEAAMLRPIQRPFAMSRVKEFDVFTAAQYVVGNP